MAKLIWITGLSGSGKTTIGKEVYRYMKQDMPATVFLDGDNFREIIGFSQGYSKENRYVVAMQIARMCKYLVDQDINVVCSTISLFKDVHIFNRDNFVNYYEIFVECSMDELIRRDQKGIYSNALKGEINNVVGIDIDYDKPISPTLVIDNTEPDKLEEKVNRIVKLIKEKI